MLHDSTSQAIAGSSSVGSPWNVTFSVPPLTGSPVAAGLPLAPPSSVEPPQAVSPSPRASSAASATATHGVLCLLISPLLS